MINYNWISATDLIEELKLEFPLYFTKSMVDLNSLYEKINQCNSKVGEKYNPRNLAVLEVENYKVCYPSDFLTLLKVCSSVKTTMQHLKRTITHQHIRKCHKTSCEELYPCDYRTDKHGNIIEIHVIREFDSYSMTDFKHVNVHGKNPTNNLDFKLHKLGQSNGYNIVLHDDYIETDFESGTLYIEYIATTGIDDTYVIDHPTIKDWVKKELTHTIMYQVYMSGEDVLQRYQESARVSSIAYQNAKNLFKPEVHDLINFKNDLYKKSKRLNLKSL